MQVSQHLVGGESQRKVLFNHKKFPLQYEMSVHLSSVRIYSVEIMDNKENAKRDATRNLNSSSNEGTYTATPAQCDPKHSEIRRGIKKRKKNVRKQRASRIRKLDSFTLSDHRGFFVDTFSCLAEKPHV